MNKLFTKIVGAALGLTMAIGVGVAVASNREATPVHASAPNDSGINADTGKFVIDFYDSGKLSSTSGTGLSSSNYSTFVKVDTGLTKTNVVTGVSVTGTVQYGKNGGLTAGTSTASASTSHYVTFNIGSDYAVTKCSVYATAYETGRWLLNGNAADSGSLGSKGATITNVTSPLVWDNLGGITALTFKKDNGSGGTQKRLTIYTIVCEYATGGATLSSIAVKTAPTKTTGYFEGQYFDPTGLVITGTYSDESTEDIAYADHSSDFTFTPSISTALSTSDTSVTIGYGGKSTTQTISVSADVLNSVSISGNMSTTSYTTANSWDYTGLTVTGSYTGKGNVDVTANSSFAYYKNSAMTEEVATPNDLGVGNNQTIYVKATCSGVSNASGYSQTVSVTKAPSIQNAVFDLTDVSGNNDDASITDDEVVITKGVSTITATRGGSGNTKVSNYIGGSGTYTQTRWYNGNTITFEANGNVIRDVVVVGESGTNGPTGKMATLSSWTGASSLDSSVAGQVTVTASNNATSLSYALGGTVRLTGVTIHYYAADVAATGITINGLLSSSISITPYQETRLTASVSPLDATDRTFEWSLNPSGDNATITIDENGNVAPIAGKYGATTVTATSNDGGFTATCTITVEHVSYYQAVYYPASTSSATTSGTLPDGESHTFSCGNYQTGYAQLTTNATTATLTLSGYEGQKIRAVLLKMHSNGSSGTGSLSIVAGSTPVASISSAAFSDESWNGEYTTDWVLIEPEFTQYDVQADEDIVVTVTASVNSLYLSEVRVQYEPSEVDTSAVDFAQMILDDITCNAQGTSAPSSSDWLVLKDFWDDGTTVTAAGKQTLLDAQAVEHENPSTDEEIIQAAMAKYDYIIGKYNKAQGLTTQYPDFINRNPSPIGNSRAVLGFINNDSANAVSTIVIISMISVTAIGGYFFFRKRKEQ